METIQREITLHQKQFEVLNFTTQYAAAISGVRGGKTYLGSVWAGKKIQECPGHGLIVGPSYRVLEQSTLPTFFQIFPEYRKYYKDQKKVIQLGDKNIYIRSMDDPLSAEGITAEWAWGDEAGLYSLLAWTVLRSRTSLVKGQILLTTTPYNMGWLYQDFYKRWEDGLDKELTVFSWASVENPYFPADFYEAEKTRLRPEEFARRYMGKFTRMEGLVYQLAPYHLIDQKPPAEWRADATYGGIDWGYTNPAALLVIKQYDGVYYLVDEWYEVKKTTPEIIEAAKHLQQKWGINRWYADSANPEKIQEASNGTGLYIVPVEKLKDSITHGISVVQQLLSENRIRVCRNLKNTLAEFESYAYPEKELKAGLKPEEPLPVNNHLCDVLRYIVTSTLPARRGAPITVPTAYEITARLLKQTSGLKLQNREYE